MIILTLFSFLAGIVTILSPCILPILPVILASVAGDHASHRRPHGIVVGFIASFTFFTLFLSTLVKAIGIPADSLRTFSVVVISVFGLSLLIPRAQALFESLFSRLANHLPTNSGKNGFGGGIMLGLSLGLLWTPCVGPILASVISLAISGTVTLDAFILTLAYSIGTAIPMYLIIIGGRHALTRNPWLLRHTYHIQRAFGLLMLGTAGFIYFGLDRQFQSYVLTQFPRYGAGLTQLEDNSIVQSQLVEMDTVDQAPELTAGGQWFNSTPLTLAQLRGKIVLLDFWTYTCINCQRTLPYLQSWWDKYAEDGLVIIGIHSPEFEFEKNPANVERAILDFGLTYPVMQDNDFATWRAYHNRYWPAKYLIDAQGRIRYTHFGEGDYDQTEAKIQELLQEIGATPSAAISNPSYRTYARTPELYLGSARYENDGRITREGDWMVGEEYAAPALHSQLELRFDAKTVYLVMRPTGSPVSVQVYLDDQLTQTLEVTADSLYTLVDLPTPGPHRLRLVFPDGGVELYAFTFG